MIKPIFGTAFAILLTVGATAASASTVTFTTFDSTNADQLNPVVTISDDVSGEFLVTLTLPTLESGDLVSVYFDIDPAPTNTELASLSVVSIDPAVSVGSSFSYQFENGINAETDDFCENNILSGGLALPLFEGSVCYPQTGNSQADTASPVSFKIVDVNGVLTLDDFASLGLRYKSSSNDGGSDKLYGLVATVPLPAAGWLMMAGLGGIAAMSRRKRAA